MKSHARSFCALRVDCFAPFAIACRPSIPRRPRCEAVAGLTTTDVNQRPNAGRRGFAGGLILRPHRHRSLLLSQHRPRRRRLPLRRRVEPKQKSQAATPAASGQLSLRESGSLRLSRRGAPLGHLRPVAGLDPDASSWAKARAASPAPEAGRSCWTGANARAGCSIRCARTHKPQNASLPRAEGVFRVANKRHPPSALADWCGAVPRVSRRV